MGLRVGRVAVERLACWWTAASKEERFALLTRAINGEAQAPPLEVVHLAAYLAECEAGEIGEG